MKGASRGSEMSDGGPKWVLVFEDGWKWVLFVINVCLESWKWGEISKNESEGSKRVTRRGVCCVFGKFVTISRWNWSARPGVVKSRCLAEILFTISSWNRSKRLGVVGSRCPAELVTILDKIGRSGLGVVGLCESHSHHQVEGSGDGAWAGTERATGGGWLMMIWLGKLRLQLC